MENPSQLFNPDGSRHAKVGWNITCAHEHELPAKIDKIARDCYLEVLDMKVKDVGFFKSEQKITFRVSGWESDLFVFFHSIEATIDKIENGHEQKNLNQAAKPSLLKRMMGG